MRMRPNTDSVKIETPSDVKEEINLVFRALKKHPLKPVKQKKSKALTTCATSIRSEGGAMKDILHSEMVFTKNENVTPAAQEHDVSPRPSLIPIAQFHTEQKLHCD